MSKFRPGLRTHQPLAQYLVLSTRIGMRKDEIPQSLCGPVPLRQLAVCDDAVEGALRVRPFVCMLSDRGFPDQRSCNHELPQVLPGGGGVARNRAKIPFGVVVLFRIEFGCGDLVSSVRPQERVRLRSQGRGYFFASGTILEDGI